MDCKNFYLIWAVNWYLFVAYIRNIRFFYRSKECLPYLKKSSHPHILNLSPPLLMSPKWFANNVAYTMAKYGMSMCVLGMHEEFRPLGIGVNALWPKTGTNFAYGLLVHPTCPITMFCSKNQRFLLQLYTRQQSRCLRAKNRRNTAENRKS